MDLYGGEGGVSRWEDLDKERRRGQIGVAYLAFELYLLFILDGRQIVVETVRWREGGKDERCTVRTIWPAGSCPYGWCQCFTGRPFE